MVIYLQLIITSNVMATVSFAMRPSCGPANQNPPSPSNTRTPFHPPSLPPAENAADPQLVKEPQDSVIKVSGDGESDGTSFYDADDGPSSKSLEHSNAVRMGTDKFLVS